MGLRALIAGSITLAVARMAFCGTMTAEPISAAYQTGLTLIARSSRIAVHQVQGGDVATVVHVTNVIHN